MKNHFPYSFPEARPGPTWSGVKPFIQLRQQNKCLVSQMCQWSVSHVSQMGVGQEVPRFWEVVGMGMEWKFGGSSLHREGWGVRVGKLGAFGWWWRRGRPWEQWEWAGGLVTGA